MLPNYRSLLKKLIFADIEPISIFEINYLINISFYSVSLQGKNKQITVLI